MPLFRPEVAENIRPKLYGEVLIPTNVSYTSLSGLILAFILGLLLLGLMGNYVRSEQVVGHIVPTKGLIKILSFKPGTLSALHVTQGSYVERGMLLASVDTRRCHQLGDSQLIE